MNLPFSAFFSIWNCKSFSLNMCVVVLAFSDVAILSRTEAESRKSTQQGSSDKIHARCFFPPSFILRCEFVHSQQRNLRSSLFRKHAVLTWRPTYLYTAVTELLSHSKLVQIHSINCPNPLANRGAFRNNELGKCQHFINYKMSPVKRTQVRPFRLTHWKTKKKRVKTEIKSDILMRVMKGPRHESISFKIYQKEASELEYWQSCEVNWKSRAWSSRNVTIGRQYRGWLLILQREQTKQNGARTLLLRNCSDTDEREN